MSNNVNTRPEKATRNLLYMTQNTKYTISLISLLFIFTAGYSGYVIYQNKHNHDGTRFSLVGLLTGKESKVSKLKNSDTANQSVKQIKQYSNPAVKVSSAVEFENSQRQVIANFLDEYLLNKNTNKSQETVISTYGTANLASQYHGLASGTDLLSCQDPGKYTSASIVSNVLSDKDTTYFNAELSDTKSSSLQVQLKVVGQGNSTKVDQIFCPGSI